MTLPGKRIQESHKQEEKSGIYVRFPAGEAQNLAMEAAPQSPVAKTPEERDASQRLTGEEKKSNKMILRTAAGWNIQSQGKGNASVKEGGTKWEKQHKKWEVQPPPVTGKAQQGDKSGKKEVWFQNCNT